MSFVKMKIESNNNLLNPMNHLLMNVENIVFTLEGCLYNPR